MNIDKNLPETAWDVVNLRLIESILFGTAVSFFRLTGLWNRSVRANGDLEFMTFLDKVYWIYKTKNPIRKPRRGSQLEEFFAIQERHRWSLPNELTAERQLSLSSAGDLMNHAFLKNSRETLYRDVAEVVFGADIAMANLEAVVMPDASGKFEFSSKSGPPLYFDVEAFDVIKKYGERKYRFLATACNHSLDFGERGIEGTIQSLKSDHISFHGINENEANAQLATVIEEKGFRIGVLSFTFGLNARRTPLARPRIVNRLNLNSRPDEIDFTLLETQLRYCKQAKVDFIVAQLHWGLEYEFYPTPEQLEVAHRLAEMGVDAIIGHHPHVVQPVEYYRTERDPARIVPIFYSLGNLTNPFSAPWLRRSTVARIELVKGTWTDGSTRTYVKNARAIEVFQDVNLARQELSLRLSVETG